ncbi:TetR/AcrR family transcriptional regulator [Lentzea jiangxiensis]|uniref:Regulatory protein, tetR family n=1 Tax=Lentzea jiangxiensis TaxID=641025 RepID=A0A1H0WU30_9PSEU|nr:helix-turn-helix domain-containing protein [Lentzea jiangxiensis]SDP93706.1 regulatory protein, tetR family [Lentzea jiangxiensis]
MAVLAEQESGTAARIVAAARELVLKRGVKGLSISAIAEKAHVAKGTMYLHWKNREDLLVGLFARDVLAVFDVFTERITADPDVSRPSRLLPLIVEITGEYPFVRAMQTEDSDLLGVLTEHPMTKELRESFGPASLVYTTLPVWREHNLARTDWPLDQQAYALQALMSGFQAATGPRALRIVTVADTTAVVSLAVTALLGPETAGPEDVRAAAERALAELAARREALLASIGKQQA